MTVTSAEKNSTFDHKFGVQYWPNYSYFTLTGDYQSRQEVIKYHLESDDRALRKGQTAPATLKVRIQGAIFKKWIEYPAICTGL